MNAVDTGDQQGLVDRDCFGVDVGIDERRIDRRRRHIQFGMDVDLGAHRLREVHLDFHDRVGTDFHVAFHREVLGPDPHDHLGTRSVEQARIALDGTGSKHEAVLGERDSHDTVVDVHLAAHQVHRRTSDERRHEQVGGPQIQLLRRCNLLEHAIAEHGHAVTHGHRLDLVVGDVHHGGAEPRLQLDDVGAHLHTELRVEVRQRLVHQEHLGRAHDRPAHRHPLTLTARERLGQPIEVLGEPQHFRGVVDALLRLRFGHLGHFESEPDVLSHRHVGVQRIVLEHHGDVAIARR